MGLNCNISTITKNGFYFISDKDPTNQSIEMVWPYEMAGEGTITGKCIEWSLLERRRPTHKLKTQAPYGQQRQGEQIPMQTEDGKVMKG
jgi:hypothetical protein